MYWGSLFGLEDHVKTGRLKVFAVQDTKSFPLFPDIPSVGAQLGTDWTYRTYSTVVARAGTPQAIVDKLYTATDEIISGAEMSEKLRKAGFMPYPLPQGEAQKMMLEEIKSAKEFAKALGLPPPQ